MGEIPAPKLVDIHRDMEPVAGDLSHYPGNRYVTFNPARRYIYSADIYVTVIYNNAELGRHRFKVKPIPTLVSGAVMDSTNVAATGVVVEVPELGLTTKVDKNGNYTFHSKDAGKPVKTGRYRLVVNPDLANPVYGTLSTWLNIEAGKVNSAKKLNLPLLNRNIPYAFIRSGQPQVTLARGNMTLDLSSATLRFPNSRRAGNVHIQLRPFGELSTNASIGAMPQWLYGVQPTGIKVDGEISVTLNMPKLYGGYQYIPANGTYVVMVGYDSESDIIKPVGVGVITDQKVSTVSPIPMTQLDYIGYAMVDEELQPILVRYATGEITHLEIFLTELEDAIGQ